MMRRIVFGLAAALLGGAVTLALWWPMLTLLALLTEGPGFFSAARLGAFVRTTTGAVLVSLLPALGVLHGAVMGAARGRMDGRVMVETLCAPFAWVMTAGEGLIGAVVMVLSLMPGACAGVLIGLWLAGTPKDSKTWPDEAATGALLGLALSMVVLNLYVQWPSLTGKDELKTPPKAEPPQQPASPEANA